MHKAHLLWLLVIFPPLLAAGYPEPVSGDLIIRDFDATSYYVVLPDGIGHGGSSKPRDALCARFPSFGYRDKISAQHRLATESTTFGCSWEPRWAGCTPGSGARRSLRHRVLGGLRPRTGPGADHGALAGDQL